MPITHAFSNAQADATGTVTVWNGGTTASVAASAIVKPSDWNSGHAMLFSAGGNTTNQSTFSSTDMRYAASGNLSVGFSNGSLFYSAPAQDLLSWFEYPPGMWAGASVSRSLGGSSALVSPFMLPQDMSIDILRLPVSLSNSTFTTATSTLGYSVSATHGRTMFFHLYSQGTGASSASIVSFFSTQYTIGFGLTLSNSSSSGTASAIWAFQNGYGGGAATSITGSRTTATSSVNGPIANSNNIIGVGYFLDVPFTTYLTAGNYWLGIAESTSSAGASTLTFNNNLMLVNQSGVNVGWRKLGDGAAGTTVPLQPFNGQYSTNTNGSYLTALNASNISTGASNPRIPIIFLKGGLTG